MASFNSSSSSISSKLLEVLGLEEGDNIEDYYKSWSLFEVQGHEVLLSITRKGEVCFEVDGEFDHQSLNPFLGARILRALKKEWTNLLPSLDGAILKCSAHDQDGLGDYRKKMYKKLGFVEESDGDLYYDVDI